MLTLPVGAPEGPTRRRAPADEVGGDVLGLGGEDEVLQPVLQTAVVGDASEERHRRVGMGVDEAWDDRLIANINGRGRVGPLVGSEQRGNLLASNGNGAVKPTSGRENAP